MKYENKNFLIRPVESHKELIIESKILDHCVRTYAERVALHKTMIFFVRKQECVDDPFVTLELKDNKIVQCRGKRNTRPSDEVVSFVNAWCRKFKLETCFV